MEVKPIMTRKLRRRPNDPVPIPDKRRKPAPDILLESPWSAGLLEASVLPSVFQQGRKWNEVLASGFNQGTAEAQFLEYDVW